jgi:integrase
MSSATPHDPELLRQLAASSGLSVEELTRRLAAPAGPTVAAHIADYLTKLGENTRRTYATALRRFAEGVGPVCDQTCEPCLDPDRDYTCHCDCRACVSSRLTAPRIADEPVSAAVYSRDNADRIRVISRRLAIKKGIVENRRRARRGLVAKSADGFGAEETAVAALRSLYAAGAEWCGGTNAAAGITKPRRRSRERRPMHPFELVELCYVTATGGNDPELDALILDFAIATGARREGIHTLTVGQLHPDRQMVALRDKFKHTQEAPVSSALLDRLTAHAVTRGGPHCDRSSRAFIPDTPVFWYGNSDAPKPITERRLDYIVRRWQTELGWANNEQLGFHHIRHTIGWLLEGRYGRAFKRRYLRHADGDVTDGYGMCTMEELTRAMTDLLDFDHPLVHGLEERRLDTLRRLGIDQ